MSQKPLYYTLYSKDAEQLPNSPRVLIIKDDEDYYLVICRDAPNIEDQIEMLPGYIQAGGLIYDSGGKE